MDSLRSFLTDEIKITEVIDATAGAAGATDIEGAIVDMAGFAELTFGARFGAITAGAVTGIRVEQSDADDLSDAEDVEGSAQVVADDDDNQWFFVNILAPEKRYLRLVVDRATQNAVVSTAIAIQSKPREKPTTFAVADLVNLEQLAAPVGGTA